uniref:Uncharacterized protein n=1 Tax=Medicago truncatula TaxID=3880 RepID=I3SCT6_MEDTR|nr:unknown [Medicago truncatula]
MECTIKCMIKGCSYNIFLNTNINGNILSKKENSIPFIGKKTLK